MNSKVIKLSWLLATSCLILVSLFACRGGAADNQMTTSNVTRPGMSSVPRAGTANVTRAETANVTQSDIIPHVTADGRLSFVDDRKLTFRTSGNVGQINVNELDKVIKGQALAKLDTTSLEQAVRTAELGIKTAELAQQSAQMDRKQAEYSVNATEADLKQAQNSVKSAAIDLDTATDSVKKITYPYTYSTFAIDVPQALGYITDAKRQVDDTVKQLQTNLTAAQYGQLVSQLQQALDNLTKGQQQLGRGQSQDVYQSSTLAAKDFWTLRAAQQAMDKAQVALENAQNTANKAAMTLDNTKTALDKVQVAVDKSNNDMDIAKNNLSIAKTNLEYATITAPFDGVIAEVNVKVGDFLSPSSYTTTVAIEIIDPSHMELDVNVNELDVPHLKIGQKVTITVDALPGKQFKSVVSSVGSVPDVASNLVSYVVKIFFDVPPNLALKAGMAAIADITAD